MPDEQADQQGEGGPRRWLWIIIPGVAGFAVVMAFLLGALFSDDSGNSSSTTAAGAPNETVGDDGGTTSPSVTSPPPISPDADGLQALVDSGAADAAFPDMTSASDVSEYAAASDVW